MCNTLDYSGVIRNDKERYFYGIWDLHSFTLILPNCFWDFAALFQRLDLPGKNAEGKSDMTQNGAERKPFLYNGVDVKEGEEDSGKVDLKFSGRKGI